MYERPQDTVDKPRNSWRFYGVRMPCCGLLVLAVVTSTGVPCTFLFEQSSQVILLTGARCSSVVRAFAHSAMGRQTEP